MARIKEIREAIATKLDKWEAEAAAIESQLTKAIAQEEKTKIQNQLEHLPSRCEPPPIRQITNGK